MMEELGGDVVEVVCGVGSLKVVAEGESLVEGGLVAIGLLPRAKGAIGSDFKYLSSYLCVHRG